MAKNGTKGMSEILGKVRVPKRTKEAAQMGEAYEPTQTAIQYWQAVEAKLKKSRNGYEKAIADFKAVGGTAEGAGDDMILRLKGTSVRVCYDIDQVSAVDTHLPVNADQSDLDRIANAVTAVIGLSRADAVAGMVRELRAYVENDGYLVGMNSMVNKTVLQNPVLTALTMIPDESKGKAASGE